jgi:hypothetical protein
VRRLAALALPALLLAALAPAARAADWGLIVPGESTLESVRARYGQPTKAEPQKIDNYDATQWVYEGAQAPAGMLRMTVDFGLLTGAGYKKDVVRSFRLDPKPGVFNRKLVTDGWGQPTKAGLDGNFEIFLYGDGLLVYFDKDGPDARMMIFTPPQPISGTPAQR